MLARAEAFSSELERRRSTRQLSTDDDCEDARTLRPLQAAAVIYRIAFGPRAGQKMRTLRGAMPR